MSDPSPQTAQILLAGFQFLIIICSSLSLRLLQPIQAMEILQNHFIIPMMGMIASYGNLKPSVDLGELSKVSPEDLFRLY